MGSWRHAAIALAAAVAIVGGIAGTSRAEPSAPQACNIALQHEH